MNGKTIRLLCIYLIFGFLFISSFASANNVIVYNLSKRTRDTVPAILNQKQLAVSVAHLAQSLGMKWQWDQFGEQFTVFAENDSLHFFQDNSFYRINGEVFQYLIAPTRVQDNLYLHCQGACEAFSRFSQIELAYSPKDKRITFDAKKGNTLENEQSTTESPKKDLESIKTEIKKKEPLQKISSNTQSEASVDTSKDRIRVIVIDPGHGGKDPGALGPNGLKEKDVILSIGLAMRDELKKSKNLKVYMTRSNDTFIPLRERTKFANDKNADLFISIHANSIGGNKKRRSLVKGYKIYFLSQAKNEDDKLTAMIENSVIELEEEKDKGDYLQNILIDMANNEFLKESQDLSILIAKSFDGSVKKVKKLHTGVGQANFWVLNGAYMPAVLVEACFISNPIEAKLLSTKSFRKSVGIAIAKAVIEFKKKYEAQL